MLDWTIKVSPREFEGVQPPSPENFLAEPARRIAGHTRMNSIVAKHGEIHLQERDIPGEGPRRSSSSYGLIVVLGKGSSPKLVADVEESLRMMGTGALSIWKGESKEGHPCVYCTTPNTQKGRSNPVGHLARMINDASIGSVRVHAVDELIPKGPDQRL